MPLDFGLNRAAGIETYIPPFQLAHEELVGAKHTLRGASYGSELNGFTLDF